MGRGRLPVIFMEREKSRKATFTKRTQGIKKKFFELSRVNAAMITYDSESANARPCPNNDYKLKAFLEERKSKIEGKDPRGTPREKHQLKQSQLGSGTHVPQRQLSLAATMVEPNPLPIDNEMLDFWSGFNPASYYDGMQFQNNNYYPAEPGL
ncbi:hypothetical protein L6164_028239 [Bauhinia variegata]|uniref:Uncharacterized protein n=1 Tax=Bauhinia variegata TaxID=167791 RepID=A0ACB9LX39_BAUVA|nr:hypothetical protein L6164_028239 [Bauhinia variegata]